MEITCPVCNCWLQDPVTHITSDNCPKCGLDGRICNEWSYQKNELLMELNFKYSKPVMTYTRDTSGKWYENKVSGPEKEFDN